LSKTSKTR